MSRRTTLIFPDTMHYITCHMRSGFIVALIGSVVACGGESLSEFSSEYFDYSEQAIDGFLRNETVPVAITRDAPDTGILKVFDGNGDGYPDLFHATHYKRIKYTGTGPSYGMINYFENDRNGKFVNRTNAVFGSHSISSASRKIKIYDLNKDGKDDIFIASNRDDGRSYGDSNSGQLDIENLVFLSQANGTYKRIAVGVPAFTHDIQIGDIDSDGSIEFIDANFTKGNKVYDMSADGGWVDSTAETSNISAFSAQDSVMEDFDGDNCLDLVSTSKLPNSHHKSHFKGDCQGGFTFVKEFTLGFNAFQIVGTNWVGDTVSQLTADVDGQWITGIANYWSTAADFDNDGDIDILYQTYSNKVTSADQLNGTFDETKNIGYYCLMFMLENTPDGFVKVINPIFDFSANQQILWSSVVDLNGDGFLDLVGEHGYIPDDEFGLNEAVFLNDGNGRFRKIDTKIAAGTIVRNFTNATPIDVNRDNIMDFVLRDLSTVCSAPWCINEEPFRLLIGKKQLPGSTL